MIINVCFGTADLVRGARFYDALAAELGLERYMDTGKAIGWRHPAVGLGLASTLPFNGWSASGMPLGDPPRVSLRFLASAMMAFRVALS